MCVSNWDHDAIFIDSFIKNLVGNLCRETFHWNLFFFFWLLGQCVRIENQRAPRWSLRVLGTGVWSDKRMKKGGNSAHPECALGCSLFFFFFFSSSSSSSPFLFNSPLTSSSDHQNVSWPIFFCLFARRRYTTHTHLFRNCLDESRRLAPWHNRFMLCPDPAIQDTILQLARPGLKKKGALQLKYRMLPPETVRVAPPPLL